MGVLVLSAGAVAALFRATGWVVAAYLLGGAAAGLAVVAVLVPGPRTRVRGFPVGTPAPSAAPDGAAEFVGLGQAVGPAGGSPGYPTGRGASVYELDAAPPLPPRLASRHRPLLDYAEDPLTPAAAETVAAGLDRLFLRLGPPPGAARSSDQAAPAPRGDDR
ncbi:hypothetical protein [Kitasatospora sp. NPDC018619]|uniref:hypothetical protein n=1 Tax=unclassified Kitasatospora TaxID=2633591 RepID=UPI0037BAAF21